MCPHSCAGVGELTRRRPVTPLLFAARGTPKWSLPARAGLQRQSPTLGSACGSVEAPRLSHRSLSIPVFPAGQGLASREALSLPPAAPAISRQSRQASRTGAGRRPRHKRRDTRGERLQALGLRAVRVAGLPAGCRAGAPGRHATRCFSSAGTWPPRRCRKETPRRRFFHSHVHLVCAPQACRCYPAGATRISARPHPPRPQRFDPCIWSLLGVSAAASKTGRRLCERGCPAYGPLPSAPTFRPRLALTFSCGPWGSVTAPGLSATATASWRIQQEGVPEAQAPSLNTSQAVSIAPSPAGHPP